MIVVAALGAVLEAGAAVRVAMAVIAVWAMPGAEVATAGEPAGVGLARADTELVVGVVQAQAKAARAEG